MLTPSGALYGYALAKPNSFGLRPLIEKRK